ncbi:hypothetical protein BKA61DRAFT_709531 [Leptodontidium sp. MPI-SDFR-AT-0119]|nr:hypothetical protein BKA61DRAFT_709531 [Leptodontidium sp. MPI-SDFR-AT-0119]
MHASSFITMLVLGLSAFAQAQRGAGDSLQTVSPDCALRTLVPPQEGVAEAQAIGVIFAWSPKATVASHPSHVPFPTRMLPRGHVLKVIMEMSLDANMVSRVGQGNVRVGTVT